MNNTVFVVALVALFAMAHGEPSERWDSTSWGSSASDSDSSEENMNMCDTCMEVWKELQEMLDSEERQDEIEKYLHMLCESLPRDTTKMMCNLFVDMYWPALCDLVENHSADEICQAVGLCSVPYNNLNDRVCRVLSEFPLDYTVQDLEDYLDCDRLFTVC